ncbi:tyrosine-type recombinase/integrase [Actinomadura coerulea]|uniref:tyrosine-type recombinase/integrase n=1 Tax=Actinomadura coerulea TaxID=46159 RepID=UPI0034393A2E
MLPLAMPADDDSRDDRPAAPLTGLVLAGAEGAHTSAPVPLTGRAPARTPRELAELMRAHGLGEAVLAATAAWLSGERRSSPRTQTGYARDLAWWLTYAAARGLDPADVPAAEADLYAAALRAAGLADATRARRLAAASSWYRYLARTGAAARNPFGEGMERPTPPKASATRGLSEDELQRLLAYAAARESARTYALLAVMIATGCRVSSVTGTTLGGLGRDRGHATLDLPVKGGATKRFVLPPFAADALDRYLADRAPVPPGRHQEHGQDVVDADTEPEDEVDPPLFATRTGRPIDQPYVFRLLQRVAKAAGITGADGLSPHSLRHSVATLLLDRGHPLHVVQDFLGHADPRTTRRYDHARESLDRSPAYDLGAALAAGVARHTRAYG